MTRVGTVLLAGLWLALSSHFAVAAGGAQASEPQDFRAPSSALAALDPYLVAPQNLGNIDLSSFLATDPNLADFSADALAADGASAAIILFETASQSDVTFSIADGTATLLPYAANFLTQSPQAGTPSLVVTSANFIQANGRSYAAVLLQGPLAGYSAANAIEVDATQDGASVGADLALVIPPLVLVHGLWGDRQSLAHVKAYIDAVAPWKSQRQLVVPICYSLYLAFDAESDPLTKGNDPCEVTSQAALQTEIDSLLAELDSLHIVGGRVDIAAHSMGGLASRNYASQSGYASLRNRMLGQFHTIVTLDSPEIGSQLANYLVRNRSRTRRAPKWTPPGFIWSEVCGASDVEACFNANRYPLAAPSLPIDTGGVYSLEPNGPSLQNPNLVGPNIANATWRALSATAPNNSALALGLNTLISALYANPYANSVPTLNSILGKLPNDAIVTVASQTSKASQSDTLTALSHTSLVSSILTWLTGDGVNDNSVTDDPSSKVYELTACWLATSGSDSCKPQPAESPASETAAANIVLKPADRIEVYAPAKAVLGTPFEVAVRLRTPGSVPGLSVYQRGETGRTAPQSVAVSRSDANTVYARVTPTLLGPVTIGVRAVFSDGSVSAREADAFVTPPAAAPSVFKANELPTLVMTLNAPSRSAMAHPFAIYPAPVGEVDLDSTFVSWRLLPQKGAPVVTLQPNGLLRARAPGVAVAEAHFGASVDRLRIVVRATQQ
ncbi:MAG TPA: hypothetical protein VII49_04120 [Rhizomicrobium sp.]